MIQRIQVATRARDDWVDITEALREFIAASGQTEGVVTVFVPHTTAGVTIQENADPPLKGDIARQFDRVFPWRGDYRHCEDNAAAHMKACCFGNSAQVIVENRRPILGAWQNLYLCEFDGPRQREVVFQISPAAP